MHLNSENEKKGKREREKKKERTKNKKGKKSGNKLLVSVPAVSASVLVFTGIITVMSVVMFLSVVMSAVSSRRTFTAGLTFAV